MTLYVFGDSFAREHREKFCWYHIIAENLNTNLVNFGEDGTGCTNMIKKFTDQNFEKNLAQIIRTFRRDCQ